MDTATDDKAFPPPVVPASVDLAALHDAMPAGLCQLDSEFRFVQVNSALAKMNGLSIADHLGKTPYEVVPNVAAAAEALFRQVFTTGVPMQTQLRGSTSGHPQEEKVWDEHWYPLRDVAGRTVGVGVIVHDVTDRIRAEHGRALAEAAKDRFLAVLSHELRTPLTPAVVAVDSLLLNPDLAPEMRGQLEMVQRNLGLEITLIDDLLDFSRIVSGKLYLEFHPVDLNRAVCEAWETCKQSAREKHVLAECSLAEGSKRVRADPTRLQQILWNLLRNAVKFTPEGGRVTVRTSFADDSALVTIQDSGVGIAGTALKSIFNAFEQGTAEPRKEFGGLGLGLAITRSLVELHSGEICAESAGPGKGSTFTLRLPIARNSEVPPIASPAKRVTDELAELRVLLVEDHHDTATVLTRGLSKRVRSIHCAHSKREALELCEHTHFDVVLSDIGLPDGTGYDLIVEVNSRFRIPAIAMSGYGMAEDRKRSREAGFLDHLVKPVRIPQVLSALGKIAELRSAI